MIDNASYLRREDEIVINSISYNARVEESHLKIYLHAEGYPPRINLVLYRLASHALVDRVRLVVEVDHLSEDVVCQTLVKDSRGKHADSSANRSPTLIGHRVSGGHS